MKRLCPFAVLILIYSSCSSHAAGTAETAAKIDKLISVYSEYGLFSGTVLVSAHDQVIF